MDRSTPPGALDGRALARYRATWQHLEAAQRAGGELLRQVPPEEMARLLAREGVRPPGDEHELLALLRWLREVAASERCLRRVDGAAPAAPAAFPRRLALPGAPRKRD